MHDLSKYSPSEFIPGVKYYQDGHRSPNNAQREDEGVSKAWLHHKGRNKHHFEYWIDYDVEGNSTILAGMKMPVKYVAEMFCDRVAASRIYYKDKYKDSDPFDYYIKGLGHYIMHPETDELLHNGPAGVDLSAGGAHRPDFGRSERPAAAGRRRQGDEYLHGPGAL